MNGAAPLGRYRGPDGKVRNIYQSTITGRIFYLFRMKKRHIDLSGWRYVGEI